jgi:hypothetical protein
MIAVLHPGTGGILDLQTFSKSVDVIVGPPAAAGGLVEANAQDHDGWPRLSRCTLRRGV